MTVELHQLTWVSYLLKSCESWRVRVCWHLHSPNLSCQIPAVWRRNLSCGWRQQCHWQDRMSTSVTSRYCRCSHWMPLVALRVLKELSPDVSHFEPTRRCPACESGMEAPGNAPGSGTSARGWWWRSGTNTWVRSATAGYTGWVHQKV